MPALSLSSQANATLQEFGGLLNEANLSFEDVCREYLSVRALELQKIGIAPTNKTVTISEMVVANRNGVMVMPTGVGDLIPGAVEWEPNNVPDGVTDRRKVTLVAVDQIPDFEGERAIAFYGDPMRYRLSFDSWTDGRLFVYYDPIELLSDIEEATNITFPQAFWTLLTKKTAFNLVALLKLKLAWHQRGEEKEQTPMIWKALDGLKANLGMQVAEWELEFAKWISRDLSQTPFVRRSNIEIMARDYNSVSNGAFDCFE